MPKWLDDLKLQGDVPSWAVALFTRQAVTDTKVAALLWIQGATLTALVAIGVILITGGRVV